jgi:hypothetical protein
VHVIRQVDLTTFNSDLSISKQFRGGFHGLINNVIDFSLSQISDF